MLVTLHISLAHSLLFRAWTLTAVCSEWAVNQHRDTYASYISHHSMLDFFAIAQGQTRARVRHEFLKVTTLTTPHSTAGSERPSAHSHLPLDVSVLVCVSRRWLNRSAIPTGRQQRTEQTHESARGIQTVMSALHCTACD